MDQLNSFAIILPVLGKLAYSKNGLPRFSGKYLLSLLSGLRPKQASASLYFLELW